MELTRWEIETILEWFDVAEDHNGDDMEPEEDYFLAQKLKEELDNE